MFPFRRLLPRLIRLNSTAAASPVPPLPPLLATIRTDLKTAMRSKNQTQLLVLRSLLAEITNAQKTATPPTNDLAILEIINKTRTKAATSVAEFRAAGREDLVAKEEAQVKVLEEYAALVETVGVEELRAIVEMVVARLAAEEGKATIGGVMKVIMKEFEGKPVAKVEVVKMVKKVLKEIKVREVKDTDA